MCTLLPASASSQGLPHQGLHTVPRLPRPCSSVPPCRPAAAACRRQPTRPRASWRAVRNRRRSWRCKRQRQRSTCVAQCTHSTSVPRIYCKQTRHTAWMALAAGERGLLEDGHSLGLRADEAAGQCMALAGCWGASRGFRGAIGWQRVSAPAVAAIAGAVGCRPAACPAASRGDRHPRKRVASIRSFMAAICAVDTNGHQGGAELRRGADTACANQFLMTR